MNTQESPPVYDVIELSDAQIAEHDIVATPCQCEGACRQGLNGEYCVNWLARSFEMKLDRCAHSKEMTWHRNGLCSGCHPLFPDGPLGNA